MAQRRWPRGALLFLVAIAVVAVYLPLVHAGFVYDDHRLIEMNPTLSGPGAWLRVFTADFSGDGSWQLYRPFASFTWVADRALFGPRASAHHLVNLAWHLLAMAALYWLAHELVLLFAERIDAARVGAQPAAPSLTSVPLVATALFGLHPLNVEAVSWISRRPDLIAGAASLAVLASIARWLRTARSGWLAAVFAASTAAFFSKESAVALPPAAIALLVLARARGIARPSPPRLIAIAASCFLPAALYVLARFAVVGSFGEQPLGSVQSWLSRLPATERLVTAVGLIGHYVRLLVFPRILSADYSWRSFDAMSAGTPWVLLGALATLGGFLLLFVAWKRHPIITFGLLFELIAIAPVSNLIVPLGTSFAERLFYVPLAGVSIAAAAACASLAARSSRPVVAGVLTTLLIALGARSAARVREWKDDDTLFRSVLAHYPNNVVARTYAAIGARERGDGAAALAHYDAALAVEPEYHLVRVNRALLYLELGDAARAADEARYVIARDPLPGAAHLTLAHAERALGRFEDAAREYEVAASDPRTREEALRFLAAMRAGAR